MSTVQIGAQAMVVPVEHGVPVSVAVYPGAGCTCLIEFQIITGGGWFPWEPGPVNAPTGRSVLTRVTGVRFSRIGGTNLCVGEVA